MTDVTASDLERVGAALPNYEVTGELGRGGWGVVLEGRHRQLGRPVAIKQLPPAFAVDPEIRARFFAEARVLASLDHPHVVPIYDYVEQDGLCLLVMEKLPGGTVWSRFTTTGLTMPQACAVTMAACAGLHCAHEQGILHRDVKPENLMFSSAGMLKVTDFGIARMLGGGETMATRAGEVLGTPAYMAPEQARNGELSPATDVYATGVMLYELLSGRLPFVDEGDAIAMLFNHVYEDPEPLTKAAPSLPSTVADVAMKAMSRAPEDRYSSAEEFGSTLADAALAAWGPGWLTASGVSVMATGRMAAATERTVLAEPGAVAPGTVAPGTTIPQSTTAPGTAAPGTAAPGTAAPGTHAPVAASTTAPTAAVRPTTTVHMGKASAAALQESDLVPVSKVVERARAPIPEFAACIALLVVAAVIAVVGLGSPDRSGDMPKGAVTVAGVDPTAGSLITVDLAQPVTVNGTLPATAAGANELSLGFSAAGVSLGKAKAPITPTPNGQFSATFKTSGSQYLVAGRATGEVAILKGATTAAHQSFAVKSKQSPWTTIPGAVGIASLLFIAGYPGSLLRAMRRGRKRASGVVGFVVLGGIFGVFAVVGAWLAASKEPVVTTLAVAMLVGAVAGIFAGLGGLQLARRRRPVDLQVVLQQLAAAQAK
jgi:hypothetical protein